MEIRLRSTGQVMYEGELRSYLLAHGGPSFNTITTEVLEAIGADVVLEGPQPTTTKYQGVARDGVEQINGQWFTKWSTFALDQAAVDEAQAKAVRDERTKKLADSDWTQVADAPVDKQAWATYRQQLRDITKQSGFPWEVVWPQAAE